MQTAITAITVVVGMVFSLAVALLVEELIFGKVFCAVFARQGMRAKASRAAKRNQEGEQYASS